MRVRTVHLAALLLLLATFGVAEGSALPPGEYGFAGHYVGVLLCSDCPGIWTDVTLTDFGPNWGGGHGSFVLIERFTGGQHAGETITLKGDWSVVDWAHNGNYTGTLELRPVKDGIGDDHALRYFFCDHGRSLRLLDQNRQGIPTLKPVSLSRVIPQPEPRFTVTPAAASTVLYARVGDTFEIDLPIASLTAYRTTWTMRPPAAHCVSLYSVTGFGNQDVFSAAFTLKADSPGKVRLEFDSSEGREQHIAFDFLVRP